MIRKTIVIIFICLNPIYSIFPQSINTDKSFTLYSGDGKEFTEDGFNGQTTLFFYESKGNDSVNTLLKDILAEYDSKIEKSNPNLNVLAVANCTSAVWPFKGLWRDGLIKKSLSKGFTIYGDWDGNICKRYNLEEDEANFLIINPDGEIIYQNSGFISETEIDKILKLLKGN